MTGVSEYRGQDGRSRDQMIFGPDTRTVDGRQRSVQLRADPNTNYTARVSYRRMVRRGRGPGVSQS